MAVTFLLALPVTFIMEAAIVRHEKRIAQSGGIEHEIGANFRVIPADADGTISWSGAGAWGEYSISRTHRRAGWPTITSADTSTPELSLRSFDRIGSQPNDRELIGRAIGKHLRARGESSLAEALAGGGQPTRDRAWPAVLSGAALWWVMLAVASQIAIGFAHFGWRVLQTRGMTRAEIRRSRNQCVECGYSLRGLDFSARCPECGALVE